MSKFKDIEDVFQKFHTSKCPCKYSIDDFVNHDPLGLAAEKTNVAGPEKAEQKYLKILLLDQIQKDSPQKFSEILKSHFLIIGTKFHPDTNVPQLGQKCVEIMCLVNQAFFNIMGRIDGYYQKNVVKKENNVYTYEDANNITGSFLDCFTVYSHPGLTQTWVELLGRDLKVRASRLPGNKGVQFGSHDHAKYVTVYDNGTILSQGVMGLHYGVEVISRDMLREVQCRSMSIECKIQKRSAKFRENIKMFDLESIDTQSTKATSVAEPDNEVNNQRQPCSSCIGMFEKLQEQLKSAVDTINHLKQEITSLKQAQITSPANEVVSSNGSDRDVLHEICKRLEVIENDQKMIKSTFGSQMASVIRNTQRTSSEDPERESYRSASNQTNPRRWETQSNIPAAASQKINLKAHQPVQNSGNQKFVPENTLVIYDFKEQAKTDRVIRQLVNKSSTQAVVQNITRTGERNPKYMVQFASKAMKDEVLAKWDSSNLGSSKVRNTTKESNLAVGYAKFVPVEIEEEELNLLIEAQYPGATVKRINKGGKPLETVRIYFATKSQLDGACVVGLPLSEYDYRAPITPERPHVLYTQCYRCWKFGHIAKICGSPVMCKSCGDQHPSDACPSEEVKCSNCAGNHQANEWKDCRAFENYKQKCLERFERKNGSS